MVLFKDFVKIIRNINNINNDIIRLNKLIKNKNNWYYNEDIHKKKLILNEHLNFQLFYLQKNVENNQKINVTNLFDD